MRQDIVYRVFSYSPSLRRSRQFQNETGIQVIYPYVEPSATSTDITDNPNLWYQVDAKGAAQYRMKDGDFRSGILHQQRSIEGAPYNSLCELRAMTAATFTAARQVRLPYSARVCYYNYYTYLNGHEPVLYLRHQLHWARICSAGVGIGAQVLPDLRHSSYPRST